MLNSMLAMTETEGAVEATAEMAELTSGTNLINELLKLAPIPDFLPLWVIPLTAIMIGVSILMGIVSLNAMAGTWMERKVSGHIQCRFGPMRAGWHGFLQPLADGIKLMLKEDMIPIGADRILFVIAPALVLASILGAMAAMPLSPDFFFADADMGIFLILAMTSTTTIGVIMAGWASNSKWSIYGAMREAAQVVAYEIPLGVSLLVPLIVAGTFNLNEASELQAGMFGIGGWFIFDNPFMFPALILFFIAVLAETKRAPFDLPESESELVSGFLTEYSGIRWSFFFMEEYAAMFMFCVITSFFFLGGFNSPLTWIFEDGGWIPNTILWNISAFITIVVKGYIGLFVMMWVRWTLPRLRIDQVMTMGYKYLTPLSLLCVLGAGIWEWGKLAIFG
ncbi:MAG: NADH-quinone oxidoreductase subunit H [Planctomycetota bacterium]|jgi:NADH-quinone oxidoreductase subunit H